MIKPMTALGQLMRAVRLSKDHTQAEAASDVDLKRGIWSLYEEGYQGNPTMGTASGIAQYIGRTIDDVAALMRTEPAKEMDRPADVTNKGQKKERKTRTVAGTGDARKRTATT